MSRYGREAIECDELPGPGWARVRMQDRAARTTADPMQVRKRKGSSTSGRCDLRVALSEGGDRYPNLRRALRL
jgi:hypothetical protein